jgi:hypothetical protein
MVTARIEFKQGRGAAFCFSETQDVIEMQFETVDELIQTLRDFETEIYNCIAAVNGKVLDLREVSGLD